jgi:hypothetical protein
MARRKIGAGREMSMDGHVRALRGEDIARLAYQIWEERGRPIGSAEADWYEAERQLQIRGGAMPTSPTGRALERRRTRPGGRTKRRQSA